MMILNVIIKLSCSHITNFRGYRALETYVPVRYTNSLLNLIELNFPTNSIDEVNDSSR